MQKVKKILEKENTKSILILLIASIFICIPLLNSNINITYDDGIQHICRLMGTYQSIQEGQTFPVIMSQFCNGFGYSWNLFYSPVTTYLPLLLKLIGLSFIGCIKIFMFIVVFLSGLSMYFFTKEVTKNKNIALLAGLFYIFAPYRLTDMYARNALAELTSFVFLPMIFHRFIWSTKRKEKERIFINNRKYRTILNTYSNYSICCYYLFYICFNTS